ncbi:MAG: helix-turn-helix transcriptional regulator [Ruminococcus sp.]|nr:helix-turn-helix transcriptional regulator [Ruminococcus sp.]MBO5319109.1 helix-turn-helix transcriptional regulator [Ruminococcus sp.]
MGNAIDEEICLYLEQGPEEYLAHYGMPRRSGRYPYGSGDQPFQHGTDFLGRIDELKKSKFTYTDETGKKWTGENAIAKSMGLTSSEYRRQVSWANYERRLLQVETAKSLKSDGLGATEIGRKMGIPESTVRSLLDSKSEGRMQECMNTVNFLRDQVDQKKMIDVGTGVDKELGISKERLDTALDYLVKAEGYEVYKGGIPQINNAGQQTNQKVLCVPGTEHKEIYNYDQVKTITEYASTDNGQTYNKFRYPASLDSKRMMVRYAEDGGIDKDGVIELRRGVEDISLGDSKYSQVRILVDGTHYLKGMALYSDDMPDGVDVVFNTNKKRGTPALGEDKNNTVLKHIKTDDPDNPFGSLIKPDGQSDYIGADGKSHMRVINKRADEGDWSEWADALPSQFLGKQSRTMAKKQLGLAKADKEDEFAAICELNNPTIKKHLLEKFADDCDSSATHLKAAALPGQKYHVIVPNNTLKDNEIYAPGYENGSQLALIRYPHAGTFEIPIVTVNNKNPLGKKLIGTTSIDAVCVNAKVAERLSGADFDGDTVMCIPTNDPGGKVKVTSTRELDGLKGFDPKLEYSFDETRTDSAGVTHYYKNGHEFKVMKNTGTEMGKISNLITDMTLGGASEDKLARAVRHSMVVIDAEKHKLDYKASEIENNIAALRKEFQTKIDKNGNERSGGASTILSRAKGEYTVERRQGSFKINQKGKDYYDPTKPEGAKLWKTADDLYYPDRSYSKNTGLTTVRTIDGKKITYDAKNAKQREEYEPSIINIRTASGKKIKFDTTDKESVKEYKKFMNQNTEKIDLEYTNKAGTLSYKYKTRTQKSTNMAETDDAYTLVSAKRHSMELLYADYANDMKALANKARLEQVNSGKIAYSANAKKIYASEVKSLMDKLNNAQLNTTRERQAQRLANAEVIAKTKEYKQKHGEDMKSSDKKKMAQQALTKYRSQVNAIARRDRNIDITDKEWEAIQAGAITESKLTQILNNTDIDTIRAKATPRNTTTVRASQVSRIKAMAASNYTLEEIAKKLGLSKSTVAQYAKGVK